MTDGDDLRRLADVVDALDNLPIDVDGAQLLEADAESIRGQLTVTVPDDVDFEPVASEREDLEDDPDETDVTDTDPEPEVESDKTDGGLDENAGNDDDPLDHTSTEDLQLAYDDADGNISAAAERFEVSYGTIYQRMVDRGVHDADSYGDSTDEDGTSTEDDTDRESEARSVDLEENAADDGADHDNGTDVQEETSDEAITVDAVDDVEEPDETDLELPDGVTPKDVRALATEHETVGDVGHELGISRGDARAVTVTLGCYSDLKDLPRGGR